MRHALVWNGTPDEFIHLREIVDRNCKDSGQACGTYFAGKPRCAAHEMLIYSQRGLDDLVYGRRMGPRLWKEETGDRR